MVHKAETDRRSISAKLWSVFKSWCLHLPHTGWLELFAQVPHQEAWEEASQQDQQTPDLVPVAAAWETCQCGCKER